MIKQQILEDLKKAISSLDYPTTDIVCNISKNPQFGDYSTNIPLQLAKLERINSKQSPAEIANQIIERLQVTGNSGQYLEKAEVAGGGFINFYVKEESLLENLKSKDVLSKNADRNILIEYGHTNPLKEIHIGHLRTFILGESLCRILESLGNKVFRANYQGDIGLHIAKAIWGVNQLGLPSKDLSMSEKAEFLGKAYAKGSLAYDEDPKIKTEIDQINKKLYQKDPSIKEIYELARGWSLEYFEPIYELLGVKYDRCFFESEVFENGKKIVSENIGSPRFRLGSTESRRVAGGAGKVFEESEGAIIFPGQKFGLHNRVFITSAGNPTYEGKEIGLAILEYQTFNYDKSIHVVASEQDGYFQVVIAAIEAIFPHLKGKKEHLSYGVVDLKEGKMSSRSGNVVTVDDLYHIVSEKVREVMKNNSLEVDQDIVSKVALGAIKFSYLKYSPRPNIIFDLEQSVSLNGDSGPYVQYTYARIQSILKKSDQKKPIKLGSIKLDKEEKMLLRQLLYFQDIVEEVVSSKHPNLLATYLLDLSKLYNFFYQKCKVIGSDKEDFRLNLSSRVAEVLKTGLYLLGIEAPERM